MRLGRPGTTRLGCDLEEPGSQGNVVGRVERIGARRHLVAVLDPAVVGVHIEGAV